MLVFKEVYLEFAFMEKFPKCVSVKIMNVLSSLDPLMCMISDLLGPTNGKILIVNSSGDVSITSDGASVLSSISASHPVARILIQACKDHHRQYGDNTKTCFVMIYSALTSLSNSTSASYAISHAMKHSISKQQLIFSLKWFKDEIFCNRNFQNWIVEKLGIITNFTEEHASNIRKFVYDIARTSLIGNFSSTAADSLAHLSVDMLMLISGDNVSNLSSSLSYCVKYFDDMVVEAPGLLMQESRVMEGILLSKPLPESFRHPISIKGAVVQWDDTLKPDTATCLDLRNNPNLGAFMSFPMQLISQWIRNIIKRGVNVLFYQGKASDLFRCLCEESDLDLLDCLTFEQTRYLCSQLQLAPICDVADLIKDSNVIHLNVSELLVGTQFYINITAKKSRAEKISKINLSILVCSPSPGLCHQYKNALYNVLLCLHHWLNTQTWFFKQTNKKSDRLQGISVKGAGTLQMVLQKYICNMQLLKEILPDFNWSKQVMLNYHTGKDVIGDMLLAVPKILHQNSTGIKDKHSRFVQEFTNLGVTSSLRTPLYNLDYKMNHVKTIEKEESIVEPLTSQLSVIINALNAIMHVLKIEDVISVNSGTLEESKPI